MFRLPGGKGKEARRVLREVALAAEILQRQEVLWHECPQYDFKYPYARFGEDSTENGSCESVERAALFARAP